MKIKHNFNIKKKKIINRNLPVFVEKFNNFYVIKIFGVIGNISIILFFFLSELIQDFYLYLIITLIMIYFIYILFISITKINYIIYLWKNKKETRSFFRSKIIFNY